MEVRVRYLSFGIAKSFGSSEKLETIHLSREAKYQDVLNVLGDKLRCHRREDEELLETFVLLCDGRVIHRIKDETVSSDCKILVGYADFGG